jgi:hypothetical protein
MGRSGKEGTEKRSRLNGIARPYEMVLGLD